MARFGQPYDNSLTRFATFSSSSLLFLLPLSTLGHPLFFFESTLPRVCSIDFHDAALHPLQCAPWHIILSYLVFLFVGLARQRRQRQGISRPDWTVDIRFLRSGHRDVLLR